MDAVDTLYANTRNNPVEDIELHLPLRVNRYELREDVIAPGEWRGGIGSVRVFTYLTDGGFSVEGDGQKHRPWGFDGGTDGLPGELIMETKAGTRRPRAVTVCLPTVPAAAVTAIRSAATRSRYSTTCSTAYSRRRSPARTTAWRSSMAPWTRRRPNV